ncbi:unnamed protein product [Durusdinium trenchii]|uniref:Uncharacterized protein n=1 Tax=Durusdinium trenchii TaxID=1381693 RepID=A0ABP0L2J8_9DINO
MQCPSASLMFSCLILGTPRGFGNSSLYRCRSAGGTSCFVGCWRSFSWSSFSTLTFCPLITSAGTSLILAAPIIGMCPTASGAPSWRPPSRWCPSSSHLTWANRVSAGWKELRILWSPPYLSRLWCIFELGAYRMANPSGTISIKPLFVEVTVLACWLGIQLINLLWVLAVALTGDLAFYTLLPALVPLILIFHSMRQHLLARQQLLDGLARFDLNQVECRLDFDKKFVHEAISEWYGGPEAFTEYVRGPLHQELISANVRHVRQLVPCQYCCIIITPMLGVALNSMVGLAKAQAPLWIAVAFFFAVVLGLYVCWFALMIQLAFFLCDRFAKPWPCLDWLQTILIFLFFAVVCASGLQLGVIASDFGPGSALLWFWVVATTLWLTRGGWGQVCRFCDACFRARAGKGLSGPDS